MAQERQPRRAASIAAMSILPICIIASKARLAAARPTQLRPLEMTAVAESGSTVEAIAFNEVSLLRQTKQAAHVRVSLNGVVKLDELICDGILVSTPAGSTAYNLSAHGPILPLDSRVLAMTAISPFRPPWSRPCRPAPAGTTRATRCRWQSETRRGHRKGNSSTNSFLCLPKTQTLPRRFWLKEPGRFPRA